MPISETTLYEIYKFLIPIFLGIISFGLLLLITIIARMAKDIGGIKVSLERHDNKVESMEKDMEKVVKQMDKVEKRVDEHHDIIHTLKNKFT